MSILASLLVRDGVLPVEKIQDAIQQQVLRGGNLDTVLLELGVLPENAMNAYCAAVFGLLPATRSEVMQAGRHTTSAIPREFAVRHRLLPVAKTESDIVLVVDRPADEDTLGQIDRELDLVPAQRIVSTVRLEAGLAHHYDIELTTRMRLLADTLARVPAGDVPYVAPYQGMGTRSVLPPRPEQSGSYRRQPSSIPVDSAVVVPVRRSPLPPAYASTVPPENVEDDVPLVPSEDVEDDLSFVPEGTFRDSKPGPAPRRRSELDEVTGRYSLMPGEEEVLGPKSARPKRKKSRRPSRAAPRSSASSDRRRTSSGARRGRSSIPPDGRRENDGSALHHDVVHISDVPGEPTKPSSRRPSEAPRSAGNGKKRRSGAPTHDWRPSSPAEAGLDEAPAVAKPGSLPSVIVDVGEDVEAAVSALVVAMPEDDEVTILPVLGIGEAALPALVREFPGRLWFDRNQAHTRLPAGRDVSAICRALVAFGNRAVPYVASLIDRPKPDVRFYATLLAGEFVHPELVLPVGRRLFDPDAGVRNVAFRALSVLHVCEPEFSQLIERLRSVARARRDREVQAQAVEALGRLRDVESFEFFVSLLDENDSPVTQVAHAALVRLTCQDFGSSSRRWDSWRVKHQGSHRVEWLIEGLTHNDERLRRRAGDELKHLTQEYFGYHPTLPKQDREQAQEKYRHWWQRIGRRLFDESPVGS